MTIAIDKNGHYDGNLRLSSTSGPLPEGLVSVGGYIDLWGYGYPLPAGLTAVEGKLSLDGYEHPLPAGLVNIGGEIDIESYRLPLPAGLVAQAPLVEDIDQKIYDAVNQGAILDMSNWHTCDTTHCRAGWAIHFAGKAGVELEDRYGSEAAGALIYERSTGQRPDFYADDEVAWADICRSRRVAMTER